jgi:hypothetical protein
MTDNDWRQFAGRLLGAWPQHVGQWGEEGIAAYVAELEHRGVTPEAAHAALDRAQGAFPPSAPELASLVPGVAVSSPQRAWELVEEAIRKFGTSIYASDYDVKHQAAVDWLADRDPVVAWWAARRELFQAHGSLGQEPINGEHGGAVRHRLEQEFKGVATEAENRVALGKPITARELTVRTAGEHGGGMADLVERLRPARELEAGK